MKRKWLAIILSVCVVAAALFTISDVKAQTEGPVITGGGGPGPIPSAFTYQGMLRMGGTPVTGLCDFQFKLFDQSSTPGNQIGIVDTQLNVNVTNGLFYVVLNFATQFDPKDSIYYYGFSGAQRWLDIAVRCPAGSGSYTPLLPRQPLWAVPYAITLMPGAHIVGTAYQNLKVISYAPTGSVPAALTGEIKTATDGVGVYGSNEVTTTGATGMGVWGRTWSPQGIGVAGTAINSGAIGVYGESYGNGAAIKADNFGNGVAIRGSNNSANSVTIQAQNTGGWDTIHTLNSASDLVFAVKNNGQVWSAVGYTTGFGDLAEKFNISSNATPDPGTLMVIDADHPGQLKQSNSAYDTKVAGIVSGAGGLQPGVTLSDQDGVAIALAGRVYVKAEAFSGAINPGDLLTSSSMPGYAMKASDHTRAIGAVIGKAMTGLDAGTGLVLVLVSLQ